MASDWSSATFRDALTAMVRRRVPDRDVEDVVQSTLVEALAAATKPNEPEAMRKWIWGIARNKVADYHRRAKRETVGVPEHSPELVINPGPFDDMLDWAMRELPRDDDAKHTFEMLLREADGDKLETIAESARLPAPRVRQRVSRLRRHFRERWAADLAALAALGIVTVLLVLWWQKHHADEPIARPDQSALPPAPTPLERAVEERKNALAHCDALEWQPCLDGLDRAKALDPEGDRAESVQAARKVAEDALRPAPVPTLTPTTAPIPTPSARTFTGPTSTAPPRATKPGPSSGSSFESSSGGSSMVMPADTSGTGRGAPPGKTATPTK
ncbi:MAG: sigma-70 family RNA polymerase sigma factor [Polyangiaceae bacterium]